MYKTIWTVSMVVLMVALAVMLTGCPKAPPVDTGSPAVSRPSAGPPGLAEEPSILGDILASRQELTSYEAELSTPDGEKITQLVKLENNAPVMIIMKAPEGSILINMEEKVMYMYSPEENSAIKMSMEGEMGVEDTPSLGLGDFDPEGAVTGSEDLDGVACWVLETKTKGEDEVVKIWVDKEYGLLRQGIDEGGETVTFTYSRFNEVPDSEFELPADVEIIDMAEMMGEMMEEMPEGAD